MHAGTKVKVIFLIVHCMCLVIPFRAAIALGLGCLDTVPPVNPWNYLDTTHRLLKLATFTGVSLSEPHTSGTALQDLMCYITHQ